MTTLLCKGISTRWESKWEESAFLPLSFVLWFFLCLLFLFSLVVLYFLVKVLSFSPLYLRPSLFLPSTFFGDLCVCVKLKEPADG